MERKKANAKVHNEALKWVRDFRIQNSNIYFKFRDRDSGVNSLSNHIWFSGTDYAFVSITGNQAKGSSSNKTQNVGIVFSTNNLMRIVVVYDTGDGNAKIYDHIGQNILDITAKSDSSKTVYMFQGTQKDVEDKVKSIHNYLSVNNQDLLVTKDYFDEKIVEIENIEKKDAFMKYLLLNNYNIILNGAPGTGKTYLAHEIVAQMLDEVTWEDVEKDQNLSSHVGFVQFHPSYDYTDFVEGLRPTTKGGKPFELLPGLFKNFCEEALKNGYENDGKGKYETNADGDLNAKGEEKPYIFIIDEINRGEMSKIFGELFFSIDPGYRGKKGKVQTQYANMEKIGNEFDKALANGKKGQFFVPKNVYIIGTMNDIDRSVESMDFAMRRRFKFVEILASKQDGMLCNKFGNDADAVICRMNNLNLAIQETEGLGSEYHIGPSYFLKLKDMDFYELWEEHLKGIIYEYLRGRDDVSDSLKRIKEAYDNNQELYTIGVNGELIVKDQHE